MASSTPPRWVIAAGAVATVGALMAIPSLWKAERPGAALLLGLCWLIVVWRLWRRWPWARARRAWREAVAEGRRLVRALVRMEADATRSLEQRQTAAATREDLESALAGSDRRRLAASVRAAQALVPGRPWRVMAGWVAGAVGAAIVLRVFVVGTFQVVSVSMAPTLLVGDLLVVDRTAYLRAPLQRGDVIVWTSEAGGTGHDYVKRVVGLPGDVVEQRGRTLWINGEASPLTPAGEVELGADGAPTARTRFLLDGELWQQTLDGRTHPVVTRKTVGQRADGRWVVEPGQVFVMGDNRDDSVDSRSPEVGQVPVEQVAGQVRWVLASRSVAGWRTDRFFHAVR